MLMPESVKLQGLKCSILKKHPDQLTEEITKGPELVPDADLRKASVGITVGYVKPAKEGKSVVKPGIENAAGETVTFKDGTSESFDAVVCATGQLGMDLKILPKSIREAVRYSRENGHEEAALY